MKIAGVLFLCLSCFQIEETNFIKIVFDQNPIVPVKDYLPFLLRLTIVMTLTVAGIATLIICIALSVPSLSLGTAILLQ